MFEKIRKRMFRQRYYIYRKLTNWCYDYAYNRGSKINEFWANMCWIFARKEIEMFRKFKEGDACY